MILKSGPPLLEGNSNSIFANELPFRKPHPPPNLQSHIPIHRLPTRLIVHDPHLLLTAINPRPKHLLIPDVPWTTPTKPDILTTYTLTLTPLGAQKARSERTVLRLARQLHEMHLEKWLASSEAGYPKAENRPEGCGLLYVPAGTAVGPCETMAVFFMHEAKAVVDCIVAGIDSSSSIETRGSDNASMQNEVEDHQDEHRYRESEAHLYLSPNEMAGTGNHSVVYNAEYEVHTDLVVPPYLCKTCVLERGMEIFRLESLSEPTPTTNVAPRSRGRIVEVIVHEARDSWLVEPFDATGDPFWDAYDTLGHADPSSASHNDPQKRGRTGPFEIEPATPAVVRRRYEGPVRVVDTGVLWQTAARGNFCVHRSGGRGDGGPSSGATSLDEMDVSAGGGTASGNQVTAAFPASQFTFRFSSSSNSGGISESASPSAPLPSISTPTPPAAAPALSTSPTTPSPPPSPATAPTQRLRVTAKLGTQHDAHLRREAGTYQEFPEHLSKHWTGFNVVPPLVDPVPVGAVVPRFYGFYDLVSGCEGSENVGLGEGEDGVRGVRVARWVDEAEAEGKTNGRTEDDPGDAMDVDADPKNESPISNKVGLEAPEKYYEGGYRSPILLMENCGVPICESVANMGIDDRQECASLFFRLHQAGWAHNSSYTRNVLYRKPSPTNVGDKSRFKSEREGRFRLIDFGRSVDCRATPAGVGGVNGSGDKVIQKEKEGEREASEDDENGKANAEENEMKRQRGEEERKEENTRRAAMRSNEEQEVVRVFRILHAAD